MTLTAADPVELDLVVLDHLERSIDSGVALFGLLLGDLEVSLLLTICFCVNVIIHLRLKVKGYMR